MDTQDSKHPILWVRKYVAPIHSLFISDWLLERGMNTEIIHDLPKLGWMVYGDEPLAAGFLRLVEGNYGLIDGLITKPFVGLGNRRRSEALDLIVEKIIHEAKVLGLKKIFAFSSDKATLTRSLKHGFIHQIDTMIVKEV